MTLSPLTLLLSAVVLLAVSLCAFADAVDSKQSNMPSASADSSSDTSASTLPARTVQDRQPILERPPFEPRPEFTGASTEPKDGPSTGNSTGTSPHSQSDALPPGSPPGGKRSYP